MQFRLVITCLVICFCALPVQADGTTSRDLAQALWRGQTVQDVYAPVWRDKVKFTGHLRLAAGIESEGDIVFRRANADLNERNFRLLSGDQLNNYENTYDPAIYSRLQAKLDAVISQAVSMYLNVTVDPWSFTGKSEEMTILGVWGNDTLTMRHYYTAASPYTLNRIFNTNLLGDGTATPEIKVKGGNVPETVISSAFGDRFTIPEARLEMTFDPLRELWFDIKTGDKGTLRIFPKAYENQALNTDDPLKLSNNRMYWEESPWLRQWKPGNLNTGGTPDFTKGKWDRSLVNATRDSDGQYLTALRGVSLDMKPNENAVLQTTVAAPKTLWQEYGETTAVPASLRYKQFLSENLFLGFTGNMHLGMIQGVVDAQNFVKSMDAGYAPLEGIKVTAQSAHSLSELDRSAAEYETRSRGYAYHLAVEMNTAPLDILNKDYFSQQPSPDSGFFVKTRLTYGEMQDGFDSSLSNYHETRDDAFWSRHVTFYPSPYRALPGITPNSSEADLMPFAVGNGLDYGRKVAGWRADATAFEGRSRWLADIRHVESSDGKKIETVSRAQVTQDVSDQLIVKALVLNHDLPKTSAKLDPFIVSGANGNAIINNSVVGGDDPSLNTGSFGARYQITKQLAVHGVWEHSNDQTASTDNFPRGNFNSSSFAVYSDDGRIYRRDEPFLYSQQYFDQAPYDYLDIFKTGVEFKLDEAWSFYLDYTRNPNRFAGNIDDNINHYGFEVSYVPGNRFGMYGRYTYARWYDLDSLANTGALNYRAYHNYFLEGRYFHNRNTRLSLQYGVGPAFNVRTSASNPALAFYSTPTMSTEHIIRMICEKKF